MEDLYEPTKRLQECSWSHDPIHAKFKEASFEYGLMDLKICQRYNRLWFLYKRIEDYKLVRYFDADYVGDCNTQRSTIGIYSSLVQKLFLSAAKDNQ